MATDQTLESYQIVPSTNHPQAGDDGSVGGNYPFFQVAQDVEAAVRALSINTQWRIYLGLTGVSFVYIGATQFSMGSVDFTADWRVGTRVQAFVTAGTIYGTITAVSFGGGLMTVTVQWDSTSLDAGLTSVRLGAVQADGQGAIPSSVLTQNNAPNYCAITNSGAAWTGALVPPILTYKTGATYKFLFSGAGSQGSDTVALNGLAAKALTKNGTVALAANDIASGQIAEFIYDGTEFQLQGSVESLTAVKAYKGTDQSVTSSTTDVDDTALLFQIAANESWEFEVDAYIIPGGGFRANFSAPAGATLIWCSAISTTGAAFVPGSGQSLIATTGSSNFLLKLFGIVVNGSTPGAVTLQWAQDSSNVTATTVKAGSALLATRTNP